MEKKYGFAKVAEPPRSLEADQQDRREWVSEARRDEKQFSRRRATAHGYHVRRGKREENIAMRSIGLSGRPDEVARKMSRNVRDRVLS